MAYIGSGLTRFNTADDLTVTDDATIQDDASVGGNLSVTGTTTLTDDLNIDSGTLFVDASENKVGVGTTSPNRPLQVAMNSAGATVFSVKNDGAVNAQIGFQASGSANDANCRIGVASDTDFVVITGNSESLRVDDSGNVGIGTSSPERLFHVNGIAKLGAGIFFENAGSGGAYLWQEANEGMRFATNNTERMRIDSSGHLLVGTTSNNDGVAGIKLRSSGEIVSERAGLTLKLNRQSSDGEIARFQKDGSTVGSIAAQSGDVVLYSTASGHAGIRCGQGYIASVNNNGTIVDNTFDLGLINFRWDDIYATNGTIQTSDRNEKQDIEELSEAEQRVAVAAKSLMRKFRWKDAVEEKGDDARIHFGIIAQDLQAAFEAEGLDAGRYAMFIYSEWWETYTDVPAVEAQDAVYETVVIPAVTEERLVSEAVLDEEGNEIEAAVYETFVVEEETTEERLVSEAVEAKEAYTRTDTYDTEEEAPEGAVKKSRMGVRYSELLAFIIAAI